MLMIILSLIAMLIGCAAVGFKNGICIYLTMFLIAIPVFVVHDIVMFYARPEDALVLDIIALSCTVLGTYYYMKQYIESKLVKKFLAITVGTSIALSFASIIVVPL